MGIESAPPVTAYNNSAWSFDDLVVRVGPELNLSGPVRLQVPCRTSSSGEAGRHDITVNADWSIDTGHNLEVERIAAALGGSTSCLGLAERGPAALRMGLLLRARRVLPGAAYSSAIEAWWLPYHRGARFASPADVAAHVRSPDCLASVFDIDEAAYAVTLSAVESAELPPELPYPGAHRLLDSTHALEALWEAGIHPGFLRAAHTALWPEGGPRVPSDFYVALAYHRPNLAYVRQILRHTDDAATWLWALTTERAEDRRAPYARAALMAEQVDPAQLRNLYRHYYSVADVRELANGRNTTTAEAVRTLDAWIRVFCMPRPRDLIDLDRALNTVVAPPTEDEVRRLLDLNRPRVHAKHHTAVVLADLRTRAASELGDAR